MLVKTWNLQLHMGYNLSWLENMLQVYHENKKTCPSAKTWIHLTKLKSPKLTLSPFPPKNNSWLHITPSPHLGLCLLISPKRTWRFQPAKQLLCSWWLPGKTSQTSLFNLSLGGRGFNTCDCTKKTGKSHESCANSGRERGCICLCRTGPRGIKMIT